MKYDYTPGLLLPFITIFTLLILLFYSVRKRSVPGAVPFMFACLFASFWALGSAMELAAFDATTKIFWLKFQAAWQLPTVTSITCFILEYAWPGRWLTRRNLILLSTIPLMYLALILTNDLHYLAWKGFQVNGLVIPERGPATQFVIIYGYVLSIVNITVFIWLFLQSPQHRWPVAVMLTGQIGARLIYLLDITENMQADLSADSLIIMFMCLMYAIALFGFRIFDPITIARQMAIAQMRGGMLVTDVQGRVVDLNPAAQAILGMTAKGALSRPIHDLLPGYAGEEEDLVEINLAKETGNRTYIIQSSALKDWRGLFTGYLLLVYDVTEHRNAQLKIVEQQRALDMLHERERLARELHDSLGQVFAFIRIQGQAARRLLGRGDSSTANEYLERIIEVAGEADVDIRESILGLRADPTGQGLFPALMDYLMQYEKNYGIHSDLQTPKYIVDGLFEPVVEVQLLRILQEALTNVRKHAEARNVRITFSVEDGCAFFTVQDDGLGFNPGIEARRSGERVGLRVMHERAEEVGGRLTLHSDPGQGTAVIVQVPVKQEENLREKGADHA